jgi:hypothetical protein
MKYVAGEYPQMGATARPYGNSARVISEEPEPTARHERGMMFSIKKAMVLSALSVAALIGFSAMSVIPANAATPQITRPAFAVVCHADACIQTASKGATYANVNAWANTTTFYGHFQLVNTGCGNTVANSSTGTWPAGGKHYTFKNIVWSGDTCGDYWSVTAWRHNSNGSYTSLGTVGFQI